MKVTTEVPILQWQRVTVGTGLGGSKGEFRLIEVPTGRIVGSLFQTCDSDIWSLVTEPAVYQNFLTWQQAMDWLRNVHKAPVRLEVLVDGEEPQPEVPVDAQ